MRASSNLRIFKYCLSVLLLFQILVFTGAAVSVETAKLSHIVVDPLQKEQLNGDYIQYILADFNGHIWKLTVNFSYDKNNNTAYITNITSEVNKSDGTVGTDYILTNKTPFDASTVINVAGNFNNANLRIPFVTVKKIKDYNNSKTAVLYYELNRKIMPPKAPKITGGTITGLGTTWAKAEWTTDKNTTTDLRFSKYTETERLRIYNSSFSKTHTANLTNLTPGTTYYYTVRARDADGYFVRSKQNSFTTLSANDTTPPSITIISPVNMTYHTTSISLNVSVSDNVGVASMWYSLNNGPNTTFSQSTTITAINGSNNNIVVYANDTSGNVGSASVSFYVDLTPDTTPPASITNLTNITYAQHYINWTWTAPADTDFTKVMVYLDGAFVINVTTDYYNYSTGLTADTEYTISTHTVDNSSNINQTWVNHTARTAPAAPLVIWPMFRHDLKHTGLSPYVGSQTNNLTWSIKIGNGEDSDLPVSSPAIGADGTIYIGSKNSSQNFYAINPNGSVKWSKKIGNNKVSSSPAIGADGTIYVGSKNESHNSSNFYAMYPTNGTIKWENDLGKEVSSSPVIGEDGTIYVGSKNDDDNSSNFYAMYPTNGTIKWEKDLGKEVSSSPAIDANGTIYVGSDKKDEADNTEGEDNDTDKGHLYAINPDGTEKWNFTTDKNVRSSPAIGANGTIYVGSNKGHLYAINPDGTEKWNFSTDADVKSSPAIGADGTIYVGSKKKLYAITDNGFNNYTIKWDTGTNITDNIESSPAIDANGTIYVGSNDNKLYAIYPNGTKKWETEDMDGKVRSSPAIGADGTIYVGSKKKLYAIH